MAKPSSWGDAANGQQFRNMHRRSRGVGTTVRGGSAWCHQQAEQVSGLGDAGEQLEQSEVADGAVLEDEEAIEDGGNAIEQALPRYGRSLFNREVSAFAY